MKRISILMILIIVFSTLLFAQARPKKLPEGVASSFASRYPDITVKSWKLKKDEYVVKFKKDDKTLYAFYGANGNWLRTETPYGLTHGLPQSVQKGWKNCDYKAWIVEGIKNIDSGEENYYVIRVTNSRTYEADHLPGKYTYDLYFSAGGDLVKKIERPFGSASL